MDFSNDSMEVNFINECPMAKRPKLDPSLNGNNDLLKESLKEFHVLDEVDGDELSEDDGGKLGYLFDHFCPRREYGCSTFFLLV